MNEQMPPLAPGSITTLICGGTSRAGLDVARLLGGRGHHCIVAGRKRPDACDSQPRLTYESVDFAVPSSVADFCKRLSGRRDIAHAVFFQRARTEDVLESVQVQVAASAAIVEALAPQIGSAVFIGSVVGDMVASDQPLAYHIAKSAVGPLVRYLAVKYGGRIRVNAISLSTLKHSQNAKGYENGTFLDSLARKLIPGGRPASAEDVANVIQFLTGPGASAITGQTLSVDGGLNVLSQVTSARLATT